MSSVECQVSSVQCRILSRYFQDMPNVECRVQNEKCQMSDVECQMSNVGCQVSGVKCRVSSVECRVLNVNNQRRIKYDIQKSKVKVKSRESNKSAMLHTSLMSFFVCFAHQPFHYTNMAKKCQSVFFKFFVWARLR